MLSSAHGAVKRARGPRRVGASSTFARRCEGPGRRRGPGRGRDRGGAGYGHEQHRPGRDAGRPLPRGAPRRDRAVHHRGRPAADPHRPTPAGRSCAARRGSSTPTSSRTSRRCRSPVARRTASGCHASSRCRCSCSRSARCSVAPRRTLEQLVVARDHPGSRCRSAAAAGHGRGEPPVRRPRSGACPRIRRRRDLPRAWPWARSSARSSSSGSACVTRSPRTASGAGRCSISLTPSWRWVFYVTAPLALLAAVYVWAASRRLGRVPKGERAIDARRRHPLQRRARRGPPRRSRSSATRVRTRSRSRSRRSSSRSSAASWRSRGCGACAVPFLDLRLFRDRVFSSAVLVSVLTGYALATVIVGMAAFVDRVLFAGPDEQRTVLGALALAMAVGAAVSGFAMRRVGATAVTVVGLGASIVALVVLAGLTSETQRELLPASLALFGLGFGLTVTPRSAAAVEAAGRAAFGSGQRGGDRRADDRHGGRPGRSSPRSARRASMRSRSPSTTRRSATPSCPTRSPDGRSRTRSSSRRSRHGRRARRRACSARSSSSLRPSSSWHCCPPGSCAAPNVRARRERSTTSRSARDAPGDERRLGCAHRARSRAARTTAAAGRERFRRDARGRASGPMGGVHPRRQPTRPPSPRGGIGRARRAVLRPDRCGPREADADRRRDVPRRPWGRARRRPAPLPAGLDADRDDIRRPKSRGA